MLVIRTDYDGSPWIKPGKEYEATLVTDNSRFKGMYKIDGELGSPFYTRLNHSCHIGGKDWEIVNND